MKLRKLIPFFFALIGVNLGLGSGYALASNDRPPPPKASVQEPTDWTELNANGAESRSLRTRTLIIQGHECVIIVWIGYGGRGSSDISCFPGTPSGR